MAIHRNDRPDEGGRDALIHDLLSVLDPGRDDTGYWLRFHRRVMVAAGPELARRRMLADVTVVDVVMGWGRALVPSALLAAAVAALVLLQTEPAPQVAPLGVEELLIDGIEGAPIPTVLSSESQVDAGGVIFAHEMY